MKKGLAIITGVGLIATVGKWIKDDIIPEIKRTKRRIKENEMMIDELERIKKEEALQHEEEIKQIKEEGDEEIRRMHERTNQAIFEVMQRIDKMTKDSDLDSKMNFHMMTYKDKDGNIHEFDGLDHEKFLEVMSDRTNKLIFD